MARGKVVIVTGIPGAGKSTVCKELLALASERGVKVSVLNYGDVMMEIMAKKGRELHRDDMRKMSMATQKIVQAEAAAKLAKEVEKAEGHVIIDTHMIVKTGFGYLPGLPKHVLEALKPDLLVLIEASPEEIAERRPKDADRRRDVRTLGELEEELAFSRMVASACSVLTGAPIAIIMNETGRQREAAEQLLKLLVEG